MLRFFVLPTERVGIYRGPKYFTWRYDPDPPGIDCLWSAKLYGGSAAAVLAADIARDQHKEIALLRDVYPFPAELDARLGLGERYRLIRVLGKMQVPAHWLTGGEINGRSIIRTLGGMFEYMVELDKLGGNPFEWPVTLGTRWSELSAKQKDLIKGAAWKCGYNLDFITVNTQFQAILKGMADQWGTKPMDFRVIDV